MFDMEKWLCEPCDRFCVLWCCSLKSVIFPFLFFHLFQTIYISTFPGAGEITRFPTSSVAIRESHPCLLKPFTVNTRFTHDGGKLANSMRSPLTSHWRHTPAIPPTLFPSETEDFELRQSVFAPVSGEVCVFALLWLEMIKVNWHAGLMFFPCY